MSMSKNDLKTEKHQLDHIRVFPEVDGVYPVEHHFKPKKPEKGDMYMPPPEPEPHFATDGAELLAHVAKHLGIKGAKEEAGEKGSQKGRE